MLPTLIIRTEAFVGAVAKVAVLALPASSAKPDEAEVVEDIYQESFFLGGFLVPLCFPEPSYEERKPDFDGDEWKSRGTESRGPNVNTVTFCDIFFQHVFCDR